MAITLSFPFESFNDSSEAFKFIIEHITFHKEGILSSIDPSGFINYDPERIDDYLRDNNLTTFTLVSNNSQYFDFKNSVTFRRDSRKQLNTFSISQESPEGVSFNSLLSAAKDLNFSTILNYDQIKSKWQSEIIVLNYQTFKRPYEHLPLISNERGGIIDISKNPGHYMETYSIALMAAPEMWFGPTSWLYFDKSCILSYKDALEIREVEKDIVYVKLFDPEAPDYEDPRILLLQKKFREWAGMDEIEEYLNSKVKQATLSAELNVTLTKSGKQIEEFIVKKEKEVNRFFAWIMFWKYV
jgi:hypothetical protein